VIFLYSSFFAVESSPAATSVF